MQHYSASQLSQENHHESRFTRLVHQHHGVMWGMFAGSVIGLATSLNITPDNLLVVAGVFLFSVAGGFCGHNMQALLDDCR